MSTKRINSPRLNVCGNSLRTNVNDRGECYRVKTILISYLFTDKHNDRKIFGMRSIRVDLLSI